MSEKILNSRIIHKHDIEAHWNLAINFIPKQGEIIVYDIDDAHTYERIKIGDGDHNINDLPFVDDALRAIFVEQIDDVVSQVDTLNILVGDQAVSEQIDARVSDISELIGDALKQSDWNQTDDTQKDFIKNKPTEVTAEDVFEYLVSENMIDPITSSSNNLYTNKDGKIYVL